MKISKSALSGIIIFHIPDLLLMSLFFYLLFHWHVYIVSMFPFILGGIIFFVILRILTIVATGRYFYSSRVGIIKDIINEFKKGRFVSQDKYKEIAGDDEFALALKELVMVGKHLDNIVTTQRDEIDKFHELYNNIVFSISSYFIVMDDDNTIIFANEGFCKKFQLDVDEIAGKSIEDIFYFVNARLKGGIVKAKTDGTSVILEKTHLLSVNKVSIIADIKISNIYIQGRNQIMLIIDDVTNKLRKDYQISLMSQISESIQSDVEIERVLYTILTGVTSGSGLGFNRAMLFLVDEDEKALVGKMAVGPDSFEEAIQIWSTTPAAGVLPVKDDILNIESGKSLMDSVLKSKILLNENNIFIRTLMKKEFVHVYDAFTDPGVDDGIRKMMDVKEFVVVPIIAVNRAIGIIIVDNKFNQVPIGNDSIELLSIFASQAALSIESYNNLVSVKKEMQKISRRQDAIVESEKMAAVGRIAAHIAHEIRNPLVTMGGYARRISQQTKDIPKDGVKTGDNIKKAAHIIIKESERLEKILSNVMDFTRPSKYIKEFNNINEVVVDTVELLRNLFLEKKIVIDIDMDENIPLVKSDFNQMKQVMLNLIQNAIDATPAGGSINIITENDSQFVAIRVRDTGTGIDQEDPDIVFEPFYTTKVTGVGLGLANVKKIIKDHNGSIEVSNRENAGAEFIVKLPIPL